MLDVEEAKGQFFFVGKSSDDTKQGRIIIPITDGTEKFNDSVIKRDEAKTKSSAHFYAAYCRRLRFQCHFNSQLCWAIQFDSTFYGDGKHSSFSFLLSFSGEFCFLVGFGS